MTVINNYHDTRASNLADESITNNEGKAKDLSVIPSEQSLNSNKNWVLDHVSSGEITHSSKFIDKYFDSYSVGRDIHPILVEKGLELSYLGISDEESAGWQKISSDSGIESGIHCSDCVEFMRNHMRDGLVDLTVTSPPYDSLRTYNGYEFNFEAIARELYRITKPGGVVVWVVGDAVVDGGETGTSFRQVLYFQEVGFRLFDTMIYGKTGTSYPSNGRYTQVFDYMFVLAKGKPRTFNPIKDVPKRWPEGSWGKTGRRKQDGTLDTKTIKQGDGSGFKQRSNIWIIANGRGFGTKDDIAYQHPATFPEELAEGHVITWSNPGDLVFDPLCGSGTTLKMAKKLGRQFIGIEISEEYCAIARQRIETIEAFQDGVTAA
jgi:site-specific DNA-methyltransferase (adenine-specific)